MIGDEVRETMGSIMYCSSSLKDEKNASVMAILLVFVHVSLRAAETAYSAVAAGTPQRQTIFGELYEVKSGLLI